MDRKPGHLTRNVKDIAASLVWIKVVGVGDTAVGKTCLIKHFCESKFGSAYQPTVGVDYGFKIQNVQGIDLRVHLWDLSGNAEYIDVRNELYGQSDAIFMVFDVTSRPSFEGLDVWMKELTKFGPPQTPVLCLVANKSDLKTKRSVLAAEAKKWAAAHKMSYFETSCATGENVEKLFNDLLNTVLQRRNTAARVKES